MTLLWLALAGGLGAVARLVLDGVVRNATARPGAGGALPVGTMVVNLSGSLLLGLVAGLAGAAVVPPAVQLVAGTGVLGGYTTFSTASVETVRLGQQRRLVPALVNGLGMLLGCVVAAAAGMLLGRVAAG